MNEDKIKRGRGRPKKSESDLHDCRATIRLTYKNRTRMQVLRHDLGTSFSGVLEHLLDSYWENNAKYRDEEEYSMDLYNDYYDAYNENYDEESEDYVDI